MGSVGWSWDTGLISDAAAAEATYHDTTPAGDQSSYRPLQLSCLVQSSYISGSMVHLSLHVHTGFRPFIKGGSLQPFSMGHFSPQTLSQRPLNTSPFLCVLGLRVEGLICSTKPWPLKSQGNGASNCKSGWVCCAIASRFIARQPTENRRLHCFCPVHHQRTDWISSQACLFTALHLLTH